MAKSIKDHQFVSSKSNWDEWFEKGLIYNKELYEGRLNRFRARLGEEYRLQIFKNEILTKYESIIDARSAGSFNREMDEDGRWYLDVQINTVFFLGTYGEIDQGLWGKDFVWQTKIEPILEGLLKPVFKKALEELQNDKKIKIMDEFSVVKNKGQGFHEFTQDYIRIVLLTREPTPSLD